MKLTHLISFMSTLTLGLLLMQGCVGTNGEGDPKDLGINPQMQLPNLEHFSKSKVLKIIYQGNTNAFQDYTLDVNNSVTMRAGLFDLSGEYIGLAPATWSINTSGFNSSNLTPSGDNQSATFAPTNIGSAKVTATYSGTDPYVITTTDSTGFITITHTQTPDAILITGGNNQSGIVNTNLTDALEVEVQDSFGQPIQGVDVLFSVTTGSGAIIGTNPVFTDSNGRASVLVKLGTIAGAANNIFRAQVVSVPSLTIDFSAQAQAGTPDMLTFTNSPGTSYAGVDFGSAPSVQVRDQYSNPIDLSTGSATLSLGAGSGTLSGTLSAAFVNGVATFPGISYDTTESGVVLRATYGAITGDSLAFDVIGSPPGACVNTVPGVFVTANGGCHDVSTGLTWSRGSSYTMTWYEAAWDATLPGAAPADAYDYGRTNDYPVMGCPNTFYCDNSDSISTTPDSQAYCHDMVQGGYQDWRLPSKSELQTALSNQIATGATPIINFLFNNYYMTKDFQSTTHYIVVHSSNPALATNSSKGGPWYVICVRGGISDIAQVRSIAAPTEMRYGQLPGTALKVQVEQADNVRVNAQGIPVTLSAISSGALGGTTTVLTDNSGIATFDNFTITGASAGNVTITITSPGLSSDTVSLDFFFRQKCSAADGINTINTDGGCYIDSTGLVWSKRSTTIMNWHFAVSDAEINGFAGVSDAQPGQNYCQDLVESGYSDWRMPDQNELGALSIAGFSNLEGFAGGGVWSSTATAATTAKMIDAGSGLHYNSDINTLNYYTACVREP